MAEPINEDAITAMRLVAHAIQKLAEDTTIQLSNKRLLRGILEGVRGGYGKLQKQENKNGRASLVKQRTAIACIEEAINVLIEYLQFLEAHTRRFRQGLKKSWKPSDLQLYVLADAKIYTKTVTGFNSRSRMALGPIVGTLCEEAAIDHNKDQMPALETASETTDSV